MAGPWRARLPETPHLGQSPSITCNISEYTQGKRDMSKKVTFNHTIATQGIRAETNYKSPSSALGTASYPPPRYLIPPLGISYMQA